jgi:ribonuclease HI
MVLNLTLVLDAEKGASNIQIFGHSLVVINWMLGLNSLENFMSRPLYEEIQLLRVLFNNITFHWLYRESNEMVDILFND